MDCRVHRLVADVAVVAGDRVLLVRYTDVKRYDGQTGWFLPDDFLEHLEHPVDAARRIVMDQVGLDLEPRLDNLESFGNGAWHIVFHHLARLNDAAELRLGDNVLAAEWFPLDGMPPEDEVAHHGWALDVLSAMGVTS